MDIMTRLRKVRRWKIAATAAIVVGVPLALYGARIVQKTLLVADGATRAACTADLQAKIAAVSCPPNTEKQVSQRQDCRNQVAGEWYGGAAVVCVAPSVSPSAPSGPLLPPKR